MKHLTKVVFVALALGAAGFSAGCGPRADGVAEKAGEKLDNAADDLTKNHRDITDGPAENAGEALDKAAGDKKAPDSN
jgi:hypothetical protein